MKVWGITAFGPEHLTLREAQIPTPDAGEALVEVEAVSLNYRDGMIVEHGAGLRLQMPFTPASDMVGRVVALGHGVTRFAIGDRVVSVVIPGWIDGARASKKTLSQGGPIPGMLAEYVATPAEWLVKAPETLTSVEASTLPLAATTAWTALVDLGHLCAGQTVVIQGTGGVSIFGLQFAVAHNARAIVTSSSEEKLALAKKLGASDCINRTTEPNWQKKVNELTAGRGADHILEMAGGENVARSLEAVSAGGRISIIGLLESANIQAPIIPLIYSGAAIVGISIGPRRAQEDMIRAIDHCGIKPVIASVYDFADVPDAFKHLARGAFGKVVVQVN